LSMASMRRTPFLQRSDGGDGVEVDLDTQRYAGAILSALSNLALR